MSSDSLPDPIPDPTDVSTRILASKHAVLGGMAEELRLGAAALEVRGNQIAATHPLDRHRYTDQLEDVARSCAATEVIDYEEHAMTPAFVNGHVHLGLGFLRAFEIHAAIAGNVVEELFFSVEQRLSPEDVLAFVRMGAYESLLHGVGMVWEHYYLGETVAHALAEVGLSAVVAPTLQDLSGPGKDRWQDQLAATEAIDGNAALQESGIFAALGPHATDTVSAELWQQSAEMAERLRLPMHCHAAQSIEEYRRAIERHGRSPVHWLQSLDVLEQAPMTLLTHCLYTSKRDLRQLDPERVTFAFCPYAQRIFGYPADPVLWHERGFRFVLGTDVSAGNDSANVQKEMRAVAELRTSGTVHRRPFLDFVDDDGLVAAEEVWRDRGEEFARYSELASPSRLLSHVWSVPGSLHPGFRVGALEAGTLANVAVWDRNHPALWPCLDEVSLLHTLALGDTSQALHQLWIAGRPRGTAGDFHDSVRGSEHYRESRREADERLRALLG